MHIHRSALVPYSPAEMFDLVNDIEAYPRFLPWCKAAAVVSRGEDEIRARLEIARGRFNRAFTTSNRLHKDKTIVMQLLEGPFKHLNGNWRFDAITAASCRVSLDLDFEFNNRLVDMALGPVFGQITGTLVDSFCRRAIEVYGRR